MTISDGLRRAIVDRLDKVAEYLEHIRLVHVPLLRSIRSLGWVDEQAFREEIGQELRDSIDFDHKRANREVQEAKKLLNEIKGLLKGEE